MKSRLGYNGRELVKNKTQVLEILVEIKKNFRPSSSATFQDLVQRFDALYLAKRGDRQEMVAQNPSGGRLSS